MKIFNKNKSILSKAWHTGNDTVEQQPVQNELRTDLCEGG